MGKQPSPRNISDSSDRLKKLKKERIYEYKDMSSEPGDRVYIQDSITGRWDGPATVKLHQGNEVNMTNKNSELSVSNMRVRPYDDKVIESKDEKSIEKGDQVNSEGENNIKEGELVKEKTKKGKPKAISTRQSQRIKEARNVKFAETEKEERPLVKDDDSEGIKYFYLTNMMKSSQAFFTSMMESPQMEFDEEENYNIFTAEIPSKHQNILEVIVAKQVAYENYVKLGAFEEIKDVGKKKLEIQWVCSKREKQDGLKVDHKANIVIKGSNYCPRSDNLAKVQGNLKVFLAVAANVGFDVIKFINGHEFKQRSALKKEVIVEPPP